MARYSKELSLSEEVCSSILEELRLHALQKLSERKKFQDSGLATLKVKIAGQKNSKVCFNNVFRNKVKICLELISSSDLLLFWFNGVKCLFASFY